MRLKLAQLSIRTGMIAVVVSAVWLSIVRAILDSSNKPLEMVIPAGLFTVFYFWAILLFLVVRSESWTDKLAVSPDVWASQCCRRFVIWMVCGAIGPILIITTALVFQHQWLTGASTLGTMLMSCLVWVPLFHWLSGVVICREMRWPAFLVGLPILVLSFVLAMLGLAGVGAIDLP